MSTGHEDVRDLLPDHAAGRLPEAARARVERALSEDGDLRDELALLTALWRDRPEPPADLADQVRARVASELRGTPAPARGRWPMWQLSAAALVVVALGTALIWQRRGEPQAADIEALPRSWTLDESIVAGGLVLDALSDEALRTLAQELER
ncbi:MAG: hypothetical protein R3E98_10335 [Gemmatimonadota bacterium]